tara:strand:+ start:331 stop:627 length:297 start_codon:yes stop_codon:yes gene_type:complete
MGAWLGESSRALPEGAFGGWPMREAMIQASDLNAKCHGTPCRERKSGPKRSCAVTNQLVCANTHVLDLLFSADRIVFQLSFVGGHSYSIDMENGALAN